MMFLMNYLSVEDNLLLIYLHFENGLVIIL